MKSLWHGYNVANFVIKCRVLNTRLSNSVLEGDPFNVQFPRILFQHQDWKFASHLVIKGGKVYGLWTLAVHGKASSDISSRQVLNYAAFFMFSVQFKWKYRN